MSVIFLLWRFTILETSSYSSSAYSMGVESSLLLPERVLALLLCFMLFCYLRLTERWMALLPFFIITLFVDFLSSESMMSMPLASSLIELL